jgi:hypothetical protein
MQQMLMALPCQSRDSQLMASGLAGQNNSIQQSASVCPVVTLQQKCMVDCTGTLFNVSGCPPPLQTLWPIAHQGFI